MGRKRSDADASREAVGCATWFSFVTAALGMLAFGVIYTGSNQLVPKFMLIWSVVPVTLASRLSFVFFKLRRRESKEVFLEFACCLVFANFGGLLWAFYIAPANFPLASLPSTFVWMYLALRLAVELPQD